MMKASALPRKQDYVPGLLLMLILIFVSGQTASAQELSTELLRFNEQRLDLTKTGMLVLSGWALTNIAVGGYGNFKASGSRKYFHQMNAAWNLVNLGIGALAYSQAIQADPASFGLAQSLQEAESLEKILLLNMGLDVGYMAAGAWLWERGLRKDSNRLKGYGPALLVQGGFLLVFDSILYGLQHSQTQGMYDILEKLTFSGNQISFAITF